MSSLAVFLLSAGLATLSAASARSITERLSPRARARRAAERSRPTPIAEIEPGATVRVVGRVALGADPLEAPFSGRACAHFEAVVERRHPRGYRERARAVQTHAFWIADATGRVYVDARSVIVDVVRDFRWNTGDIDAETRFELEQSLYQNGPAWNRLIGDKSDLRYSEGALQEGELVTAVGIASVVKEPEPHLYRDKARRLVLSAPPRGSLYVSDGMHLE